MYYRQFVVNVGVIRKIRLSIRGFPEKWYKMAQPFVEFNKELWKTKSYRVI